MSRSLLVITKLLLIGLVVVGTATSDPRVGIA
jgi:hypothetical protein